MKVTFVCSDTDWRDVPMYKGVKSYLLINKLRFAIIQRSSSQLILKVSLVARKMENCKGKALPCDFNFDAFAEHFLLNAWICYVVYSSSKSKITVANEDSNHQLSTENREIFKLPMRSETTRRYLLPSLNNFFFC